MKKYILVTLVTLLCSIFLAEATPKKEVQSAVLPQSTIVYEGVTRNGNPKYWIEIQGVKVTISKSNADKLKQGVRILVIKWVDEHGKYSYSTRCETRNGGKKDTPNLDLSSL